MIEKDDWRLNNQEKYLVGVTLVRRLYRQNPYNPEWDHDHCEFCLAKFSLDTRIKDALLSGYATTDDYRWICQTCFEDFKEMFKWKVIDSPEVS
ncbi:MAG: hypothetical protein MUE91_11515 [Ignavibacteriaceae bacterium]|jgi:hypothetical protein|nr:hypothetical protein [Ignavibacteriaceae bacterium]